MGNVSDKSELVEPLQIKLSVSEVRLDVVVLDKKGNPITNLNPEDFEVYQDDRRMEVLSSVYIDSQSAAVAQSFAERKDIQGIPSQRATVQTKEDVRRTILFVVDDFTMSFENGYYAKMALRNFVEKQMQLGDLVSILRTNYGNSALNMFQSDKREVLARINALPTTMASNPENDPLGMKGANAFYQDFLSRAHESQIATISHSLRALKNMPGRKLLFMVTPLTMHSNPLVFYDYFSTYIKLADEALRAGVVVNLLDIDGLYNFSSMRADASVSLGQGSLVEKGRTAGDIERVLQTVPTQFHPEPNPIPAKTGGITIRNSNFFLDGIGREVESLMRGYYLVSYEPPSDTFETRDKKDVLHRLKVNVKRKDTVVYTRDGFFGKLESELIDAPKQHPLIEAVLSPFQSSDLNVNIVAGYVRDKKAGYLVRSWMHLDPSDVNVVETEDGGARIDIEVLCVTSDIKGEVQDTKRAEFTLTIKHDNKAANLAWIQRHGIRFSLLLPVKKPGPYYVQVSIQDTGTGKIGSAYQFLEIPDIGKKGLALSNIFTITSNDDLDWMRSDVTKDIAGGVFLPVLQGEIRSPALRTYMPGDGFYTMATLYNADAKAISRSEIEMQSVLYRDGKEIQRSNPMPITPEDVENIDGGIQLLRRFTLGADMPPGDYVLQWLVTDKKNSKKSEGNASQNLSFTIMDNQTCETGGNVCMER